MNIDFKKTSVWIPLMVAVAFAGGILLGAKFFSIDISEGQNKLGTVLHYIENEYVDKVSTDSLIEKTIPDILSKLDPHSAYIPASELQSVNEELDGSFCGIGIQFNTLNDTITVVEVISGGPSEKVGIMAGDRIVEINDTVVNTKEWTDNNIISRLRGPRDTKVKLGVLRATSPKMLEFEVTRGDIPVASVESSYMLNPTTGFIRVSKFGRTTFEEFLNALVDLRSRGVQDYVIDLRGNTGGYMEIAILMANEFLPAGKLIVSTHGRDGRAESMAFSDGNGAFADSRVTVLIDEYSASASEIFAGAMQDNDRGTILGRRSFGKGLVQKQISLPDSSALRLTTARYYTPSGRCIQKTYTPGNIDSYGMEIAERYSHGEGFSADSAHIDKSVVYHTAGGREVYGGGGIMPDIFVPNDTSGISSYYINVLNAGMLQRFAFRFADINRGQLSEATTVDEVESLLPNDDQLLSDFVAFAKKEGGIAPRWYYINLSRDLIVSQLKALIARDVLGTSAFYEVINRQDKAVERALEELKNGEPTLNKQAPDTITVR